MQTPTTQLSDVIYNAATQCFEALVTVHDAGRARKYACAIDAPITMSFAEASKGLTQHALRRHQRRQGLSSQFMRGAAKQRAGRKPFDPVRWLDNLLSAPGRNAA